MIFKNCTFYNEFFEKEFGDIEIENGKIKQTAVMHLLKVLIKSRVSLPAMVLPPFAPLQ